MKWICLLLCLGLGLACAHTATPTTPVDVFSSGEAGYMCIRIPVILDTPKGLIAMAEGRGLHSQNYNCCVTPVEDFPWCTDKDIVMKFSSDGVSWSPLVVVFETDTNYFYSNPTPTYYNGYLFMVYTRCAISHLYSQCEVFFASSTLMNQWTLMQTFATPPEAPLSGPSSGLMLDNGAKMLYPLSTSDGTFSVFTNTSNMNLTAGSVVPGVAGGESQIAVLPNSQLVIQIRTSTTHYFSYSSDGGLTWSTAKPQEQLPATNCEASLLYSTTLNALLYSTPAENVDNNRSNLTVYSSTDNGATFTPYALVFNGPSAYSALVQTSDGKVGILFERGVKTPYETISLSYLS